MEIEPMRSYGGTNPSGSEELFTVSEAIWMFAEDVGLACSTVRDYRWVASRWAKERRRRPAGTAAYLVTGRRDSAPINHQGHDLPESI